MEEEVSLMNKEREEIDPVSNRYNTKAIFNIAVGCFHQSWTLCHAQAGTIKYNLLQYIVCKVT